jgi:hypothetical protein
LIWRSLRLHTGSAALLGNDLTLAIRQFEVRVTKSERLRLAQRHKSGCIIDLADTPTDESGDLAQMSKPEMAQ